MREIGWRIGKRNTSLDDRQSGRQQFATLVSEAAQHYNGDRSRNVKRKCAFRGCTECKGKLVDKARNLRTRRNDEKTALRSIPAAGVDEFKGQRRRIAVGIGDGNSSCYGGI